MTYKTNIIEITDNDFTYDSTSKKISLKNIYYLTGGTLLKITSSTAYSYETMVYLKSGSSIDGCDWKIAITNGTDTYNLLTCHHASSIIIYGDWKDGGHYQFGYRNVAKDSSTVTIIKRISTDNGTLYSPFWNYGSIKECTVASNCTLNSYPDCKYINSNIAQYDYIVYDLPEFTPIERLNFSNNSVELTVTAGSVVLTEGNYFRDDNSADFLSVNGYNVTFAITETSFHLLQTEEGLDVVEFYPMTIEVTENANTLNVRRATVLKGNPFNIILETGDINRYLERINGESLECVYGNWKHEEPDTVLDADAVVSYTIGDKKIYAYKSEGEIKIDFDNDNYKVPHYECTATKDLVVTMVRDDFVVSKNLTFRRVEYKPHVYVEKPFTYVFRNLTVTNQCTLDVLDSTIMVEGSFTVEEGATVKCKNLIIN